MSESTSQSSDAPPVQRIAPAEAQALVATLRAVLVDTRDRRLYDNTHAAGAVSLPVSEIEAAPPGAPLTAASPDQLVILYCA